MNTTKNNHYNPCFWTAIWNNEYYKEFIESDNNKLKPRAQSIFSLNIQADKILPTTIEKVFFEKKVGLAKLTIQDKLDFCKRNLPSKYDNLKKDIESSKDIEIDFENHFSIIENEFGFKTVLKVAKKSKIDDITDKIELSLFLYSHYLRNPIYLNSFIRSYEKKGCTKFEAFYNLKYNILGNEELLREDITPLLYKEWKLISSNKYIPLCDNPILFERNKIFVIISPFLILKLSKKKVDAYAKCKYAKASKRLLKKVRKLIIKNTYKEIISSDKSMLEELKSSKLYFNQKMKINQKEHSYYKFI